MLIRLYSIIFVLLWSSAFVSAKFGTIDAGPFSFLVTRFTIVAGIFAVLGLVFRSRWPRRDDLLPVMAAGTLMHGVYLGGVFYAISLGMPSGIAALVVSVQPVITAVLAIFALHEAVRRIQWVGIALGMLGVVLVLYPRLGGDVPVIGLVTSGFGVCAMSVGTIIQKRYLGGIDLVAGNALQALAAALFYGMLVVTIEPYDLVWTANVTLAMIWVVVPVSLGAVTILMLLIRSGQMAATSSLFFMVPPVSAVMGYLAFGEQLGLGGILGLVVASTGIWLVNRPAG